MTDDAGPARVALARIEIRKQISNAIMHLLDADAPIGDVVQLSYGLMREIDQSSRRDELAHVVQALEFAAGDGIVAMLREGREMQLIEHKWSCRAASRSAVDLSVAFRSPAEVVRTTPWAPSKPCSIRPRR